jgi:L-alanine-DL-glutamate epimerase-like enolase superfamily enzyme
MLEYSPGANPLLPDLVHERFPVVDGQLEVPDRPGLGITVDETFLRRHARE